MKFAKRIIALSLTLALCASPALGLGVEDKFPPIKEYPGYADVPAGAWFEPGAKLCYEVGLMTGSDKGFEPERLMNMPEVAVIMARMRDILNGGTGELPPSDPWYQSAMDIWYNLGVFLCPDTDVTRRVTREFLLKMLAAVVPQDLLKPINNVTYLPDTTDKTVLMFYNAGILSGTNKYGTFAGSMTPTRQEVAAILSRVVREDLRMSFTPADYTLFTAAGARPGDVFFQSASMSATAESYLNAAMTHIIALESSCKTQGIEFNWFNTVGDKSFLDYVKVNTLSDLGVEKSMGTDNYQRFDLQVFYSRYLDLKSTAA